MSDPRLDNAVRYYGNLLAKHGASILKKAYISESSIFMEPQTFTLEFTGYIQTINDAEKEQGE
jgi:hypothetical protein